MLMSLGMFTFELATLPFQELGQKTEWRHGSTARFGARPAHQYLGPGDDSISLSGALVPGVAGAYSAIDTLKQMGDQGENWPLVDGLGKVHGNFEIASIDERKSVFMTGGAPRKIDFTVELRRVS